MTAVERKAEAVGRRTVLGSMIALAGLGCAGGARAEAEMVDLRVVDRDTGQEMPVWRHGGRMFVAGEQGARYSLRIANRTDGRVLVVMSVDGVNIISGETARYDGRGYVLGPYGTYDINGWRKSETEVAAFAFTALPHSYAALTGRPGDVGVIGMAVFKERPRQEISPLAVTPPPPPPPPISRAPSPKAGAGALREPSDAASAGAPPPPLPIPPVQKPSAQAESAAPANRADNSALAKRDEKLGTAHGASEWSVSHVVSFVRATSYPQLIRQIEYDSYSNLSAAGVIPRPRPPRPERPPRAFPGDGGYVPDPPRY